MIALNQVTKNFAIGPATSFTAVDNVSLTITRSSMTILKGPSGSGKTTLLALIGCMTRPSSGRIMLQGVETSFFQASESAEGFDSSSLPERFLTEIRRSTFGFIFQQFNLIKGISALQNIMLPAYPTGEQQPVVKQRALGLMEQFDLLRHRNSPVEWLSGGELQRVAIARALINNPIAIIADEPTAHLDSQLSQAFMESIGQLKDSGKTVLIASHDPIVYSSPLADQVLEMRDGRIVRQELLP
ncbi:ABC transporter ATP-binding protein [Trichlorobacter lovleyi]|uniref:ABC transporter related n=1 Tax=Trichlorobacter lovleyi (strain ATCC BAA-1151 / DSM 17278 / SZ) TaxID=398767 RepID=B3E8S2_TRIL1|nr:ABC transporter ATP-binding protein [Trichlorobacter lovleyi]ACD95190.1 ABC transporter related [Trichlorobacter lovleyi SZ]